MKILNFKDSGKTKMGLKTNEGIIDLEKTLKAAGVENTPKNIEELITLGENNLINLIEKNNNEKIFLDKTNIEYAPCIENPEKIICVGLNYRKHAIESNMAIPDHPILFNKYNNSLTGHQDTIKISKYTNELDYEAELGIVIGKQAKDIEEDEVFDHIFGYFVANDISARDLQMRSGQWMLGKSSDGYLPIGPYLVTKSSVENPDNLRITCSLNGDIRQDSNTSDMIFNCKEIVSYVSKYITLEPGDIIVTGTPEGVIMGYPEDKQIWIKDGDEVTVTIEDIGSITNTFIEEN